MNYYMNKVALATFSSFRVSNEPRSSLFDLGDCPRPSSYAVGLDSGNKPSEAAEPERFYHGFVLGLLVDLNNRYAITSNRESGFGRYDVVLEPKLRDGGAANGCQPEGITNNCNYLPPPINTFFPRKAKPYLRMLPSGIPFSTRAAA